MQLLDPWHPAAFFAHLNPIADIHSLASQSQTLGMALQPMTLLDTQLIDAEGGAVELGIGLLTQTHRIDVTGHR